MFDELLMANSISVTHFQDIYLNYASAAMLEHVVDVGENGYKFKLQHVFHFFNIISANGNVKSI